VLVLGAHTAFAQQQTSAEQSCINSYGKAALRLVAARAKSFGACMLENLAGQRHIETCYAFDPDGKIEAARAKLAQVESKRCATAPDFGHGAFTAASGTATSESIALLRHLYQKFPNELYGGIPDCVAEVNARAQKILQAKLKVFLKCAKSGLADGTISSPANLAACLDASKSAVEAKIEKLVAVAEQALGKSCHASLSPPGCSGSGPAAVAACLDRIADCRACEFVNGVDGTNTDCDSFDDAAANDSCPDACGNGTVGDATPYWDAEVCDDGNLTSGDGCDSNCTPSGCGNGVITTGESCDSRQGRCQGGELAGEPCELNAQCGTGFCTSCPTGDCVSGCSACGAGTCCDTIFGCSLAIQDCSAVAGTPVECDAPTCQHSGTCCRHLYLDWGGCHSDPYVLANCENWGGSLEPCSQCEPCCAFDGYCTSWHASECLEYEGTPVDCSQCWGP
jgi:cysteine-rich repeat protein